MKENEERIPSHNCPLPQPTIPPPGYASNSTVYCDKDKGEWKWINGAIALNETVEPEQ